jgi:hypothetical protein
MTLILPMIPMAASDISAGTMTPCVLSPCIANTPLSSATHNTAAARRREVPRNEGRSADITASLGRCPFGPPAFAGEASGFSLR